MPTLLIVADPNGCGKSTLTRRSGFSGIEAIDPDALARSMSPSKATRETSRRRFLRSHSNLPTAAALAYEVYFYDNSNPDRPHRVVAIFERKMLRVSDDVPD